jgi:uncharacterized protein YlxW (UPF0749 family)
MSFWRFSISSSSLLTTAFCAAIFWRACDISAVIKGSSEEKALIQRYTGQLDQQETQLDTLRKTIQNTEAQRDKANEELQNMIDNLQLEATL